MASQTQFISYLKFWGTRGSVPVSGAHYEQFGGNTSCLELKTQDAVVIFDAGTGIRALGEELIQTEKLPIHLIISHFHWDHILGLPFFRPLYDKDREIHIYAPGNIADIESRLHILFNDVFLPVALSELKASITLHALNLEMPLQIYDCKILSCLAYHPSKTFCFKIETPDLKIGYATDNEFLMGHLNSNRDMPLDDLYSLDSYKQIDFFKGCDYLIHEAQYFPEDYKEKIGWGHSSLSNATLLVRETKPKNWIVVHHDHLDTDAQLLKKKESLEELMQKESIPCNVQLAFDGFKLELNKN